jgi:hypothetical protein
VFLLLAAAVVAARTAAPSHSQQFRFSAALACGVERWKVKTLQDRPRLLARQVKTIAQLIARHRPAHLPATRLPFERHVYRVHGSVTKVIPEADSDLHLVFQDGVNHMIAEAASPTCNSNATSARRVQMKNARVSVRVCTNAVITGVAFWDFKHGQTGVAPNAIELHPILGFACLDNSSSAPPPPEPPPIDPPPIKPPPPPPPQGSGGGQVESSARAPRSGSRAL